MYNDEDDIFGMIDEELDMQQGGSESEPGDSWRGTRGRLQGGQDSDSDLDTDEQSELSIELDTPLRGNTSRKSVPSCPRRGCVFAV